MNVTRRGFLLGSLLAPLLQFLPKRAPVALAPFGSYIGRPFGFRVSEELLRDMAPGRHYDRIIFDDLVTHESVTTSGSGMFHVPQSG
jgi:hypothetical protein